MYIEFTLLGGLCFGLSNFRVMDTLSLLINTNINIGGLLGEMLYRFMELVDSIILNSRYIHQPILFTTLGNIAILMKPFNFPDFNLDIGDRFDYRLLLTEVSPIERWELNNSRDRFIEIFEGNLDEFYEHHPEEVEGYDDLYGDEEPPANRLVIIIRLINWF